MLNSVEFASVRFVTFPGWGRLIFFETEERQVQQQGYANVASFSNLGKCWKVIFDLKPVEDNPNVEASIIADLEHYFKVVLTSSSSAILGRGTNNLVVNHQLKIGEWNRIQITHEVGEGGNFIVSLSVGDKELGKLDVDNPFLEQSESTDVQLLLGSPGYFSPTFTGRLLVIERS